MTSAIDSSKEYFKLIKRFPLLPINSEAKLDAAIEVMKDMSKPKSKLSAIERGYLHVLTSLIREYENEHYAKPSSPRALVLALLEEHGLSQTAVASELAIDRTNLSAFLSGRRQLSKTSALKLAERFNVDIRFLLSSKKER